MTSENDLIRRGDALAAIQEYAVQKVGAFQHPTLKGAADVIAALPAVSIQSRIDAAVAAMELASKAWRNGFDPTPHIAALIQREGGRKVYMGQIMAECDCPREAECQAVGRCIAEGGK